MGAFYTNNNFSTITTAEFLIFLSISAYLIRWPVLLHPLYTEGLKTFHRKRGSKSARIDIIPFLQVHEYHTVVPRADGVVRAEERCSALG